MLLPCLNMRHCGLGSEATSSARKGGVGGGDLSAKVMISAGVCTLVPRDLVQRVRMIVFKVLLYGSP